MSQFFQIHPENPQERLIRQAVDIIRKGGVIAYPTDSGYALGCHLGDKKAIECIKRIRRLDNKHNFTLVCSDLSDISTYAKVDNEVYRLLKTYTPGAYTFILDATTEVPRLLLHPKRRSIGVRIPDHKITLALLAELGEPLMSTTMIMPESEYPETDPYEIRQFLEHELDLIIDGGACTMEVTSVLDVREMPPTVIRAGKGDVSDFE